MGPLSIFSCMASLQVGLVCGPMDPRASLWPKFCSLDLACVFHAFFSSNAPANIFRPTLVKFIR